MNHVTVVLDVPDINYTIFRDWFNEILSSCANWYNTTYHILFVAKNNINNELKEFLEYVHNNPPFYVYCLYMDSNSTKSDRYNAAFSIIKREKIPCGSFVEFPYVPSRGWIYPPIQLLEKYDNVSLVCGKVIDYDNDLIVDTGWIFYNNSYFTPYLNFRKTEVPKKFYEERHVSNSKCVFIKMEDFNHFPNSDNFIQDFCLDLHKKNKKVLYTPKLELKPMYYIDFYKSDINTSKGFYQKINFNPIVGIIMPCYNSEKYLSNTLDAIINQSYLHWKLFFINDASLDNSLNIVENYKKIDYEYLSDKGLDPRLDLRFEIHNLKRNLGVSNARNIARDTILYHRPNIELIAYCDSDDIWIESSYLEDSVMEFIKNPDIDFLYSDVFTEFDDGEPAISFGIPYHIELDKEKLKTENPIYTSTVLHRKQCLTVGKFTSGIEGIEDWLYWNKIANSNYKMIHYPRKMVKYIVKREGGVAATNNIDKLNKFKQEIENL